MVNALWVLWNINNTQTSPLSDSTSLSLMALICLTPACSALSTTVCSKIPLNVHPSCSPESPVTQWQRRSEQSSSACQLFLPHPWAGYRSTPTEQPRIQLNYSAVQRTTSTTSTADSVWIPVISSRCLPFKPNYVLTGFETFPEQQCSNLVFLLPRFFQWMPFLWQKTDMNPQQRREVTPSCQLFPRPIFSVLQMWFSLHVLSDTFKAERTRRKRQKCEGTVTHHQALQGAKDVYNVLIFTAK